MVHPSGSVSECRTTSPATNWSSSMAGVRAGREPVFARLDTRRESLALRMPEPGPRPLHQALLLECLRNGAKRCALRNVERHRGLKRRDRRIQPVPFVVPPAEPGGDRNERERARSTGAAGLCASEPRVELRHQRVAPRVADRRVRARARRRSAHSSGRAPLRPPDPTAKLRVRALDRRAHRPNGGTPGA